MAVLEVLAGGNHDQIRKWRGARPGNDLMHSSDLLAAQPPE